MPIQSINPFNNELIQTFAETSQEEIEQKLQCASEAYKTWKGVSFSEKSKLMNVVADLMVSKKDELAQLMTLEMGKPIREAKAEIEKCALVCNYYADNAENFLNDELIESDASKSYISYEPLGIVLAVMPWNFPFWQVFRFAAPTLMAGNVGVLKHASNVPQCAISIEQLFAEAGFPQGVFQNFLIGSSKVNDLIEDKRIKAVTLTGSELAGSKVAECAGRNIKKTLLELGGSDPFIVLNDADLNKAVKVAVRSRMINCGQSCIAAKRFIVEATIHDEFVEKMVEKMKSLKLGDPTEETTDVGPMAREDLANELLEQVKKSAEMGAKFALGGDRPEMQGAFFNPTILTEVKHDMPAYHEEMFGPVATVIKVADENEAIQVANDSDFGLGGSVWTNDIQKGEALARKVESGAVFVNGLVKSDPRLPFGGIKNSGYGRELSYLGIREFVNQKTTWVR
ncbi:MAG: NAD-dependent succinate-semialdehyde dehydrogenase [Bacteroidia bacterium]|nr:NAD-dependent succinate-semialdehyde dehydrogenase [Bacteroidia bacterium]